MHSCCSNSGSRVGDDAGAGLDIHGAVLDQRGAQHDAGVHVLAGGEIADAAGIERALFLLQFVDDLHGAHLWRAGHRAGGKAGGERIERIAVLAQPAFDIRDDVHDLAVALDEELIGDFDRADLGDAADIVAAEIEQHQMLGAFLGIGEKLSLERLILVRRRAAPARAGDRADGDGAAGRLDQNFGARSGDREAAEIEKIQIRRRIDPAQRAVKRKRRQRERRLEALRQHDLKNIAGGDVFLGAQHHALEFLRRRVRARRDVERAGVDFRRRTCRAAGRAHRRWRTSRSTARASAAFALTPALRPHRRDDGDRVFDRIEGDDQGRADQDRVGNADRIAARRRQIFHQPHHVVAEIAENAGGHRRQRIRQRDAALADEGAQRGERRLAAAARRRADRSAACG